MLPADRWSATGGAIEHVGVYLDRYLSEAPTDKEHKGRAALYREAVRALTPDAPATQTWSERFGRWKADLLQGRAGVQVRLAVATARTRLLLHPASERTVTEGGLLLHHTWGVPYLPGSTLKGVLRAALDQPRRRRAGLSTGENATIASTLFGDETCAGVLDVPDALWIPGSPARLSPLALDVVNPHHPDWYRSGEVQPTDLDSPVPTHRLTIRPRTRFLVALEAPDALPAAWLDHLLKVLNSALMEDGLGSWTSAGYGRLGLATLLPEGTSAPIEALPAAPEPEVWALGALTRDPGSGAMQAVLTDGRRAKVAGQQARELFEGLPPELKDAVKRKTAPTVSVRLVQDGLALVIAGLRAG